MAADFTATLTVTGILDGNTYSLTQTSTVASVTEAITRRVTIPSASEVDITAIAATVGLGALSSLAFFAIRNTDSTNFVRMRRADTGAETMDEKIEPGRTSIINNTKISVSETEAAFATFTDVDTISFQADTADVVIEIIALQV